MTVQARKTILDAIVSRIETNIDDFNLVTAAPDFQLLDDIPVTSLPACIIESGSKTNDYTITSTFDYQLLVAIFIVCGTEAEDSDLYDLDEAVDDALNSDITLDGTCLWCLGVDSDPPRLWPRGTKKMIEKRVRLRYRRDI